MFARARRFSRVVPSVLPSTAAPARGLIVRSAEDVRNAGNVVEAATGTWESRRYLLRKDGLGFSFHWTFIREGTSTLIWYRNHVEAVMIVGGEGEIEVVGVDQKEGEGKVTKLSTGTMYALDGHERHFLRATKGDLQCVCVFNPPVAGTEDHNDDGVYPAVGDDGKPLYDLSAEDVKGLVEPPKSLQDGTPRAE